MKVDNDYEEFSDCWCAILIAVQLEQKYPKILGS